MPCVTGAWLFALMLKMVIAASLIYQSWRYLHQRWILQGILIGHILWNHGGDLFYVHRKLDKNEDYRLKLTGVFKVYKLLLHEQSGKVMERVELESLGDDTLFVGDNNSMAVSAANLPGCQPNSIYFTHDYIDWIRFNKSYRPHDVGVFNVKDGTFGQHYVLNALDKKMPPVLWIVPPFQRKWIRSFNVWLSLYWFLVYHDV